MNNKFGGAKGQQFQYQQQQQQYQAGYDDYYDEEFDTEEELAYQRMMTGGGN